MKKFYGVLTEVYDDETAKVWPLYCSADEKPRNTLEQIPGVTTYKDWYELESIAKQALELRNKSLKTLKTALKMTG